MPSRQAYKRRDEHGASYLPSLSDPLPAASYFVSPRIIQRGIDDRVKALKKAGEREREPHTRRKEVDQQNQTRYNRTQLEGIQLISDLSLSNNKSMTAIGKTTFSPYLLGHHHFPARGFRHFGQVEATNDSG